MKRIGLVLEGGGLRGIFTSGVLDFFMEQGLKFDYVVGVSAGAANTFGFLGNKPKYGYNCMMQTNKRNKCYGVVQMFDSHKFVDLDKFFNEYAEQYNYKFEKLFNNPTRWEMVASNIETGKAEYLCERSNIERVRKIGIASCSLPILTMPVEIDGKYYLDGGACDSIPLQRSIDVGNELNVVIQTRRKGHICKVGIAEEAAFRTLYKDKPLFLQALLNRPSMYQKQIDLVQDEVKKGNAVLIQPTLPEVGRLEQDMSKLSVTYYHGYLKAKEAYQSILALMQKR